MADGPLPRSGRPLIAYDFADRRWQPCYKCGGKFREGRYREHVLNTKHPAHDNDRTVKYTRSK